MNLKTIKHIAISSIYEAKGSKFSYIIFSFLVILSYVSILLGIMAVWEEKKILSDFFLSITQVGVLFWSLIMLATSISSDIETKRIYLILSRPVRKYEYLLGRFLGIIILSFLIIVFVTLIFFILLLIKRYKIEWGYVNNLGFIFIKICVISSISLLFTVITTSVYTSFIISMMVWFVAHFVNELKFALSKINGFIFMKYLLYLIPDFSLIDKKIGYVYMFVYFFIFTFISLILFERKEIT